MITGRYYIADENKKIIGTFPDTVDVDVDIGKENDYQITLSKNDYDPDVWKNGNYFLCHGSEIGGKLENMTVDSGSGKITFTGDIWRGILDKRYLEPLTGYDYFRLAETSIQDAFYRIVDKSLDTDFFITEPGILTDNRLNIQKIRTLDNSGTVTKTNFNTIRVQAPAGNGAYLTIDEGADLTDNFNMLDPGDYYFSYESVSTSNSNLAIVLEYSDDGENFNNGTILYDRSMGIYGHDFSIRQGRYYRIRVSNNTSAVDATIVKPMVSRGTTPKPYDYYIWYYQPFYGYDVDPISFADRIKFNRYCSTLSALNTLLTKFNKKLNITTESYTESGHEKFRLKLSYKPIEYSDDYMDLTGDNVNMKIKKASNQYTHILALGGGDLRNRLVKRYQINDDGSVTALVDFPKSDNVKIYLYDYGSVENEEEMENECRKKAEELLAHDSQSMNLDEEIELDIGDVVRAHDDITDTDVESPITQKIVKVSEGMTQISYSIGDDI